MAELEPSCSVLEVAEPGLALRFSGIRQPFSLY